MSKSVVLCFDLGSSRVKMIWAHVLMFIHTFPPVKIRKGLLEEDEGRKTEKTLRSPSLERARDQGEAGRNRSSE